MAKTGQGLFPCVKCLPTLLAVSVDVGCASMQLLSEQDYGCMF